jgi:transglutaminase superfamily protein
VSAKRLTLSNLRAALWTLRSLRLAKQGLRDGGWESVQLPNAPNVAHSSLPAVDYVLRRNGATCLPIAIVRQAWFAAQGSRRDLVVGVTKPSRGFEAHAWLEGDPPCHSYGFHELLRRGYGG